MDWTREDTVKAAAIGAWVLGVVATLALVTALSGCGHTFQAREKATLTFDAGAHRIAATADGDEVCTVHSPAPIPFTVRCGAGAVPWYTDAGQVTCIPTPCAAGQVLHYQADGTTACGPAGGAR